MSTQHTPGPWAVGSKGGHIETANAWRMSIAICYNKESKADGVSKEEFEANARLIAAAPDLLEALQEVVKLANQAHDHWDNDRASKVGKILLGEQHGN